MDDDRRPLDADRDHADPGVTTGTGAESADLRLIGDRDPDVGAPADPREAGAPAGGGPGRPPGVGPGRSAGGDETAGSGGAPDAIRSGGPTGDLPLEPSDGAPFEDDAGRTLPSWD